MPVISYGLKRTNINYKARIYKFALPPAGVCFHAYKVRIYNLLINIGAIIGFFRLIAEGSVRLDNGNIAAFAPENRLFKEFAPGKILSVH